ncbi:MAG: hypothetical protein JSS82_08330 [Bacteroidetes bacterium]|nr:hypothetical protein [Bacteroidota bacterium]
MGDRNIADMPKDYIPGWGIDADPENDPTYPMKKWNGADHERLNYPKAPQQDTDVEILKSIERPVVTRVFGSTVPPSGLSGMLRRKAFKYSEGTSAHWMGLILADRINMVEGLIDDLSKGYIPNFFKEWGWPAEWKYNRKKFVQKAAIGTAVTLAAIWLLKKSAKKSR